MADAAKLKASDLTWKATHPMETEATTPDGRRLRIKQAVGKLNGSEMFWYCYQWRQNEVSRGWCYLGTESKIELAKARALSGRMRMPAAELEDWIRDNADTVPPDLLEAEQKRLAEWKKNPNSKKLTEPVQAGGTAVAAEKPAKARGESGRTPAAASARTVAPKAGRPSQSAVVRVVKRQPTGKPGTKWRQRQEHVFSMDGKSVADIKDNDAVKHMLQDGTIRLEE